MKINFTEIAIKMLQQKINDNEINYIFLRYDIEGCGCVMSGVTFLESRMEKSQGEIAIETNYLPVLVNQEHIVFLDEELTIDYQEKYNCYQLKSPNQMLNPRMSLVV